MKKTVRVWIITMACVMMLLTGCEVQKPSEAPGSETLTPTMQEAYVYIRAQATAQDAQTDVATGMLSEKNRQREFTDASGDTVVFSIENIDPDTLSMDLRIHTPLMSDGKEVTAITIGRGDRLTLTAPDGSYEYDLELCLPASRNIWSKNGLTDTLIYVTAYYGDGVMLWMESVAFDDNKSVYQMTTNQYPDRNIVGTYTMEGDTLTLFEDLGLARLVFHRDEDKQCWRYDESASVRHALSLTPPLADGMELAFGHAYEIDQGSTYDYRVTDADGNTLLVENDVDAFVGITALSPTRLCIQKHKPNTQTQTRYLDTVTGECSITYYNVIDSTPQEIVYVENERLVIEEPLGDHTKEMPEYGRIGAADVSFAMLTEEELTVEYTDADGKQRICAWNRQTGKEIERPLLIVKTGWPNHWGDPPIVRVLDESGNAFAREINTTRESLMYDKHWVHYSGVRCAAIRIDGEYVNIADALADGTLTPEAFTARLQADVNAGTATATRYNDTDIMVYQYENENTYHGVVVQPLNPGYSFFVGDTASSLAYIESES